MLFKTGNTDRALALVAMEAVVALLDIAESEQEGDSYIDLVNAARDLGRCIVQELRGEVYEMSPQTMKVIEMISTRAAA
jgi:hypothetical protein